MVLVRNIRGFWKEILRPDRVQMFTLGCTSPVLTSKLHRGWYNVFDRWLARRGARCARRTTSIDEVQYFNVMIDIRLVKHHCPASTCLLSPWSPAPITSIYPPDNAIDTLHSNQQYLKKHYFFLICSNYTCRRTLLAATPRRE